MLFPFGIACASVIQARPRRGLSFLKRVEAQFPPADFADLGH